MKNLITKMINKLTNQEQEQESLALSMITECKDLASEQDTLIKDLLSENERLLKQGFDNLKEF